MAQQIKIIVMAEIRGHAPDLKEYARHLSRDVIEALGNKEGPDIDVLDIQIEKKLDGFEALLDRSS